MTLDSATSNISPDSELFFPIDQKKTKIVATIGPASESEAVIADLIRAGMNVARFNTKHNEPAWHLEVIRRVRKVAKELHTPIGILLDLQGPEIRIKLPTPNSLIVKKGETVCFTFNAQLQQPNLILAPENVITSLNVGNHIILDDGMCELLITEKGGDFLKAEALENTEIKTNKTMNTPGVVLEMPALLPRDLEYLDALKEDRVEFVALSFVRNDRDIANLRRELEQRSSKAEICAKIENQSALQNLDSIIAVSDSVMVARGDLAVEVPFEELTYWQKMIIRKCLDAGKPVITATQMLLSMMNRPFPSRAEISDNANAVYDGTDAVMLSEETTAGNYPVRTVTVQNKIVSFYEKKIPQLNCEVAKNQDPLHLLTQTTVDMVRQQTDTLQKIIVVCDTPQLVRQLSRYHLPIPIWAVTSDLLLAEKFTLSYGVAPICLPHMQFADLSVNDIVKILKEHQKLSIGERILFIYNFSQQQANVVQAPLIHEIA